MPIGRIGQDFIVNTTTADDQQTPVVAALADGRIVVIWQDDLGDGSSSCIRARIYNSDGSPDLTVNGGGDFIANATTQGPQETPAITALPDGRFFVTWYSLDPGEGSLSCIRGRVFSADGSPDQSVNGGDDFIVNTTTTDQQFLPATASLSDGRFVVTWYSHDNGDGSETCIRARIFSADGGPDLSSNGGNDFIVNTTTMNSQYEPSVVALPDGQFSGSGGNDYLRGEGGDDLLFGGEGDDLFAFAAGDGDDEIGDFVVGADHLVLNGIAIDTTEELDGNGDGIMDTLVTFSSGDTVLLAGVTGVSDSGDLIA